MNGHQGGFEGTETVWAMASSVITHSLCVVAELIVKILQDTCSHARHLHLLPGTSRSGDTNQGNTG